MPFTVGIFAVAKNKADLPKLVVHAKYVLVTTCNGPDLTNPKVLPDDRQAVADVEEALEEVGAVFCRKRNQPVA